MHFDEPIETILARDLDDPAAFAALLTERDVNPYQPWRVVRDSLAGDPRYLALGSDGEREAAFAEWGAAKPRNTPNASAQFASFVKENIGTSTAYPLFKRKFRTNAGFAGCELPDDEKAMIFREYLMYAKMPEIEKKQFAKDRPHFTGL